MALSDQPSTTSKPSAPTSGPTSSDTGGSKSGRLEGTPARPASALGDDVEYYEPEVDDEFAKVAHEGESDASVVRRLSQSQSDNVAIVSRRADGRADQHDGYGLVTVAEGDDVDEVTAAAIENRPERG